MRVAIDVSPLAKDHRYRGIGKYTEELVKSLRELRIQNLELRMVKEGGIPDDVDLIHYPYFDLFFLTLPLIKKKPTVVTVHDVTPLVFCHYYPPGVRGTIKLAVQKLSLQGARVVITDSESSKKDIGRFLGYPQERIAVIPLAAADDFRPIKDKNFLETVRKKYRLRSRFALYVGDININKNIPCLVKACELAKIPLIIVGKQAAEANIDRSHPENRDLVWLQNHCQRLAARGEEPVVRLLGFVPTPDLIAIYNLALIYVQPSLYEGFGLSVLEAMKCGCPVVVSRVASLPAVVGPAGFFVDPYDINDIALGIKKMMGDQKLQDQLIELGKKRANDFRWQKTARMTYEVYQKLVKK